MGKEKAENQPELAFLTLRPGLRRRGQRIGTTKRERNIVPVTKAKVEEIGETGETDETDETVEEAGTEVGETGARVDPVTIALRRATDEMTADVAGEEESTIVPPMKKVIKTMNLRRKQVKKD